jgi:hypothetical protein
VRAGAKIAAKAKEITMANPMRLARVGRVIGALYTTGDRVPQHSLLS